MAQKRVAGTGRGNWKYEAGVHKPLLLEIFQNGGDIASFCSSAKIARSTFQEWRNNFEDFHEAYERAKELARAWWERMGQENLCNPQFNTNAWRLMMRNRFDMTDSRCVSIPGLSNAKSRGAQHRLLSKSLQNGDITPDEALKLANFIAVGSKIDQVDEFEVRLKALESNVSTNKA